MRQQTSKAISRALQAALALLSAATLVLFGVLATGIGLDLPLWQGLEAVGPDEGGTAITLPGEQAPSGPRPSSQPGRDDVAQAPGARAPAPGDGAAGSSGPSSEPPAGPERGPTRGPGRSGDGTLVATIGNLRQPPSLPSDSGRAQTDFDPPQIDPPAVVPEVPEVPEVLPPDDGVDHGPPEAPGGDRGDEDDGEHGDDGHGDGESGKPGDSGPDAAPEADEPGAAPEAQPGDDAEADASEDGDCAPEHEGAYEDGKSLTDTPPAWDGPADDDGVAATTDGAPDGAAGPETSAQEPELPEG